MRTHELTHVVCDCGARLERKCDDIHKQPVMCGGETGCGLWHSCSYCSSRLYRGSDRGKMCARFGKGVSRPPMDEPKLVKKKCTCPNPATYNDKLRCPVHVRAISGTIYNPTVNPVRGFGRG